MKKYYTYLITHKPAGFYLFAILLIWEGLFFSINSNAQTVPKDSTYQQKKSIQQYLKDQSNQSFVYKKLYEWLVISKDSNKKESDFFTEFELENAKYNNKVIRSIKIKKVSPFAKNILDTLNFTTSKLEKQLSRLRFETQTSIIKNNLTFKNGEFIKPHKLKDSERLLRSLNYITDALIVVEPAAADTSLVDVLIFTQDSYPYGATLSLSGKYPGAGFYSKNVLGYGFELEHSFSTKPVNNRNFGFFENLRWQNIYGSYFTLNATYSDVSNSHYYSIGSQKNFFIPEIKYAGGFNIIRNYKINDPSLEDEYSNNYNYLIQDYWAGKSYMIRAENFFNRSNLTFLTQAMFTNYYQLPDSIGYLPQYIANTYILGSISFSKRDYYKNNLIYNYGRTEDVPYGFLGSISGGLNHNNIKNRVFLGGHFSFGKSLIPNRGFLYFRSDIQSFFYKKQPEDTRIKLQTKYISSLQNIGKHWWRSFLSVNYIKGFHNSRPDYIYINESNNGIRAFRSHDIKGTKKIVLSSENILFSSKEIIGFKTAFFSFFDMAWLANEQKVLKTTPYISLGGGLRLRNDHLVFKTIQLQLAYFPKIPPGGVEYDFRLTSEVTNRFDQFSPKKPYNNIYK